MKMMLIFVEGGITWEVLHMWGTSIKSKICIATKYINNKFIDHTNMIFQKVSYIFSLLFHELIPEGSWIQSCSINILTVTLYGKTTTDLGEDSLK